LGSRKISRSNCHSSNSNLPLTALLESIGGLLSWIALEPTATALRGVLAVAVRSELNGSKERQLCNLSRFLSTVNGVPRLR
jgi:hypothetical protein